MPFSTRSIQGESLEDLLSLSLFRSDGLPRTTREQSIESTFATVRLLTKVTRGAGPRAAGLAVVFKLVESARAHW